MKYRFSTIVTSVLATVILPSLHLCEAQSGDSSAFYKQNYAAAPQVGGESIKAPVEERPLVQGAPGAAPQSVSKSATSDARRANDPVAPPSTAPVGSRISLYVSSQDKHHFETVIRKVFEVVDKRRGVIVTEIVHVGDYRNVSQGLKDQIAARKIYFASMAQVPKRYNVQTSPTWIVRDTQGEHVVEGLLAIERCLSADGTYNEAERSASEVTSTPTIGVKTF